MNVRYIILCAFLSLGFVPAMARADTVSVLGITSVDGDDSLAYGLTAAVRGASRATPGWTVRDNDASLNQMMLLMGDACAAGDSLPEVTCLHALAVNLDSPVRADLLVYGTLRRTGAGESLRIIVELRLYGASSNRVLNELTSQVTVEQIMTYEERIALATDMVERLSGTPAADRRPMVVSHSSASFDLEYIAWPLIGLAVVSLGIEIGAWAGLDGLQHNPDFTAYRSSFGSGTGNACNQPSSGSMLDERGHSLCSQGDMLETIEWVFMAVGLGSAAAGITTLVLDLTGHPASDEHAFMIRPTLSSTRAGIELAWRL